MKLLVMHDDYIRVAESTTIECMYMFCTTVVVNRTTNEEDTTPDPGIERSRRIFWDDSSIDCMHWA
jgi:hypothetical protein